MSEHLHGYVQVSVGFLKKALCVLCLCTTKAICPLYCVALTNMYIETPPPISAREKQRKGNGLEPAHKYTLIINHTPLFRRASFNIGANPLTCSGPSMV